MKTLKVFCAISMVCAGLLESARVYHDRPVVFAGSSSIERWTTLSRDFPGVHAINSGVGGRRLTDVLAHAKEEIIAHAPRVVVMYAGDNDIWEGETPERVRAGFDAIVAKIHTALPHTRIVFVGIKPSPLRWPFMRTRIMNTNALIRARCAEDERLQFVSVHKHMLDERGQPRAELFQQDMLHMNDEGYAVWKRLLTAHVS